MFCLECGAEAPARAVVCPVCGHDLGRTSAELRSSMTLAQAQLDSAPVRAVTSSHNHQASSLSSELPSIRAGDLDRTGLPQDGMGRALLIVAIALVADMFVPWRVVYGQHETLPVAGGVVLAALILLAAAPLLHPKLRRHPVAAALPMLVGGINLGLGVAFWVYLAHSNDVANIAAAITSSDSGNSGSSLIGTESHVVVTNGSVLIGPDFGLFCFLIGTVVLIVIGYYLFLAAARATASVPAAAMHALPAASSAPDEKATPIAPAAALPAPPTPPAMISHGMTEATNTAASTMATGSINNANQSRQPGQSNQAPTPQVALPGSEAWNRATEPPAFVRTKAGSIRRSSPRR